MATSLKQAVHQNLQCPVCLSFFKEPKILTCAHTFCKSCLEALLESHPACPNKEDLSCPTCREETSVPDGDVDRLQTNITVRSLVEDVETQGQVCSNCNPEDKTVAVAFCYECKDYLCDFCRIAHAKWVRYSGHSITCITNVSSDKIAQRRWRKCLKHPTDDEECFCLDCTTYVCFKCGILEHANEAHKILKADIHETEQKKNVDELVSKADAKIRDVDKYVTLVVDQRKSVQKIEMQLNDKVNNALEEAVKKLKVRYEILKEEVRDQIKELEDALEDMEKSGREQIVQINKVCGLVKNGLQFPLQKRALTTHNKMCQQLEQLMSQIEPDEELPRKTGKKGERLDFRSHGLDGLKLGQLQEKESKWVLQVEEQLPVANSMDGMAVSPKNTMAIGCFKGGIFIYSAEGILQKTVLKDAKVRALHFMPDCGYAIHCYGSSLSLYTELCESLGVTFETLEDEIRGHGGLTVDKDGLILTSYRKSQKIQVFKPEGGKAVREIPCKGFEPMQIFAMMSSQAVVIKSGPYSVHVINDLSGATLNCITKQGLEAYPGVCNDDSVIIAWIKHSQGLVSIEQYSGELNHIKNILTDFKITKPSRLWYYLQQFKTGEIALCTPDKLYIFHETWK